jgi:hypothetical protein
MPKILKISLIFFLLFLLSGCASSLSLKRFDQKLGEIFFNERPVDKSESSEEQPSLQKENDSAASKRLTKEQEKKIDAWLEENGLNRYGDPADMLYLGGSPLFDESTGESIERYDYILKKIPDILEKIK